MLKRKNKDKMSADAKKKSSLDTGGQSSSVDTESEHLFPDTESTSASTEAVNGITTLDMDDLDTVDTLALARVHREAQGPWEAEYSYGGEADLHRHYDNCAKNPGHKNFIPVDKFSIEDLPEDYRHQDIVDYIRARSDLTVRVTVKYVSEGRPATVPGSRKPYPGYANRGQERMVVGTGWVGEVIVYRDHPIRTCKCKDCSNSSTPETTFATVEVVTSQHVVFDDLEAEHTTCHLFFDSGGTPDTCSGVVTLTRMECEFTVMELDMCYLNMFTHDLELADRLQQTWTRSRKLMTKLSSKLPQISYYLGRRNALDKQPLVCIVSHPHGCRKHISLGRLSSLNKSEVLSCQYTTATCPGSSGAGVCMPHEFSPLSKNAIIMNALGHHCGACDERPGINYSNIDENDLVNGLPGVSVHAWPLYGGPWADILVFVDEEDLHKHADTYQKITALRNCCPVDKFSMDYLPPIYRVDETMEVINILSGLTVQVSVTCVSEERPKAIPDTNIPCPWYKTRGCNQLRVGCGWMSHVVICLKDDVSPLRCKHCFGNLPQKSDGAYIYVRSVTRLIYDRMEAEHTTCHLFSDSCETPDLCKYVVTFTDLAHYCNHGIDGKCTMVYAINDQTLAKRLKDMTWRFKMSMITLDDLLCQTYSRMRTNQEISNPGIPTCIMVSHPHGRAKQICVSCVGNHDNADTNEDKNPGVSIICPGSYGAPVIVLYRGPYPYSVESVMSCGPGYGDSRYTMEVVHEKWEEGQPGNWKQWRYDDEPRMNTKKGCPGGCLYNVIADASKVLAIVDTC